MTLNATEPATEAARMSDRAENIMKHARVEMSWASLASKAPKSPMAAVKSPVNAAVKPKAVDAVPETLNLGSADADELLPSSTAVSFFSLIAVMRGELVVVHVRIFDIQFFDSTHALFRP